MKSRKILFPTDFSETANAALRWALFLAEKFGAELTMFHAVVLHGESIPDPEAHFPDLERLYQATEDLARDTMAVWPQTPEPPTVPVEKKVVRGISPYDEILREVHEGAYDLIIMATHGRTGLRHLLLGSVAEQVIRLAPCPVLAIRIPKHRKPEEPHPWLDRILYATDFSQASWPARDQAVALAREFHADLHVVHVIPEASLPSFYGAGLSSLVELDQGIKDRARQEVEQFMASADDKVSELHILHGTPHAAIVDLAKKIKADLVVVGTHGLTGLPHLLIGSTAERVLRHAPCPILVARALEVGGGTREGPAGKPRRPSETP